ncbi:glycosyltransferase family 4 protein [Homoserinibacter sp. GY 40078]|nr:glycosyltransferase family 4 protein [Homoserinibacter sp. GY 40078]
MHEWVELRGGSERVLEAIADAYPDADIYCLWNDAPGRFPGRRVHESWLARTPLSRSKVAALPFMPMTWRRLRPAEQPDWILASSHLFAHHAQFVGADVPKLAYVHTPARYIWTPEHDPRGRSPLMRAASTLLKPIDRSRAQDVNAFAANSAFVRDRIRTYWDRDADVIHPPIDVERIREVAARRELLSDTDAETLASLPDEFVLGASRFVPYKGLDTVLRLAAKLDLPVVLAGGGSDEARLRAIAADLRIDARFVHDPSDELLVALFGEATVYVFPPIEDFGMMPVEALAAGGRVVVNAEGGAREGIAKSDAACAIHFGDLDAAADQVRALIEQGARPRESDVDWLSRERFQERIRDWVGVNV